MNAPLRYLLVGTGGMGAHWCQVTLPRLTAMGLAAPAAAVDVNEAALANAQRWLGVPAERCYTNLVRALDENPADFVVVVTPSPTHEGVIEAATSRGLDVLCEKPLAHTMAGCCRIAHRVSGAGRRLAVTMSHRFDQDKQSLEAAVRSGEYGPMHCVIARFAVNNRHRGDIPAGYYDRPDILLIEAAAHHLDILRAVSGGDAATVYAQSWNPPWSQFAGHAATCVTATMTNGVRCQYEGSMVSAAALNTWCEEYVRAECEKGTLELDRRRLRLLRGRGFERPEETELPLLPGEAWTNPLLAEMFCRWLLGERGDHPTSLADNMQCCAFAFAAVESSRRGAPVDAQAFLREQMRSAAAQEAVK